MFTCLRSLLLFTGAEDIMGDTTVITAKKSSKRGKVPIRLIKDVQNKDEKV